MNGWMNSSLIASPGGHPSTIAPSAGPWLSPQVVKRSTRPKVFQLMPVPSGASVGILSIMAGRCSRHPSGTNHDCKAIRQA